MGNAFVDNGVPGNSFVADIRRGTQAGATTVATSVTFESATPNRPGKKSNRPDIYGGPNGFLLTLEQETGSAVIQITTTTTETPAVGDWVSHVFNRKTGAAAEIWVLTDVGEPNIFGEYARINVSMQLAHNPP